MKHKTPQAPQRPKDHVPVKVVIRDGWVITVPASGCRRRKSLLDLFRRG